MQWMCSYIVYIHYDIDWAGVSRILEGLMDLPTRGNDGGGSRLLVFNRCISYMLPPMDLHQIFTYHPILNRLSLFASRCDGSHCNLQ